MKAVRSNTKVSPFGGIVPILRRLKSLGVPEVIRKCLGKRDHRAQYSYEDIFIAWILTSLCGGTRLEHISKIKNKLNIIPELNLPSHDTLGRVMKGLATKIHTKRNLFNKSDTITHINENLPLNRMLIEATKSAGALNEEKDYTLDIDATFISTECRGAIRKRNEKTGKVDVAKIGFNPMVCMIENLPVFISMRDGYANAHLEFANCLKNCLTLFSESRIKIARVISDAAGYNKEALEMLHTKGIKFVVRFPYWSRMHTFNSSLASCSNWKPTEISTANFNWVCEVGDVSYKMHDHYSLDYVSPTWRVVAMRIPVEGLTEDERKAQQVRNEKMKLLGKRGILKKEGKPYSEGKWVVIGDYKYKFVITNDYEKSAKEIITEFNKRGTAERVISFMKNDFAWRLPPFMNMNENTVFMIAASLANNVFRSMVMALKEFVPGLRLSSRLREFKFLFIDIACAFIEDTYVFYNEEIEFEKIM